MSIFGTEPTYTEIILSYIYNYVILATIFSLCFVYYLFRTRAPLKEDEVPSTHEKEHDKVETEGQDELGEMREKSYRNGPTANAIMANGDLEVADGDKDLLKTILHGMNLADTVAAEDEAEEAHDDQRVTRGKKVTENEEEEEDGELLPRRRQIIREVTVRKIFLPPDARYADVENAAKRLIGEGQTTTTGPRKDSGTGGTEFRTAITNIRDASKRLEGDDLSPVPKDSGAM